MDTIIGKSYFNDPKIFKELKTRKTNAYPYLEKDIKCDILIIGGGIQGSILNYYLADKYNVVLVEQSMCGCNSTSIATALLEFQLDDFASDLQKYMTEDEIVEVYKMGLNSFDKIQGLIDKLGNKCIFARKPSLLYSNRLIDVNKITKEYDFRIEHNFACRYIDQNNNPFGFDVKAGIFDMNGGAEFNPYLFAKQMIENSSNQQSIYENTKIISIKHFNDRIICTTKFGFKIECKKVIIATGFDLSLLDDKDKEIITNQLSYTIVTKPIENIKIYQDALVQDTLDNYHYMRVLPDKRIIFGGEDTPFNSDQIDSKLCQKKYNSLLKNLKKLMPDIQDKIEVEYSFAGLFATTDNNLGVVGQSSNPDIYYFLSCGANGIINTFCGVEIIEDLLQNKVHKLVHLFSPTRK